MKGMKVVAGLVAVSMLLVMSIAPAQAAKKKKKKKPAGPVVAFEDPSGDAGFNDVGPHPGAAEAGFDLTKGEISMDGKDAVKFVVTHDSMPSSGPPGELFRMIWGLSIDGTQYEITVKSLDVGEPDVIATVMGQSPNGAERIGQVYQGVARFEECGTISLGINWSQCTALGYYDAVFDPATATVTWSVDLETMGAKKGTVIAAGGGGRATTGCMICWVPQYQERSLTPNSIIDAAVQLKEFKVP